MVPLHTTSQESQPPHPAVSLPAEAAFISTLPMGWHYAG